MGLILLSSNGWVHPPEAINVSDPDASPLHSTSWTEASNSAVNCGGLTILNSFSFVQSFASVKINL